MLYIAEMGRGWLGYYAAVIRVLHQRPEAIPARMDGDPGFELQRILGETDAEVEGIKTPQLICGLHARRDRIDRECQRRGHPQGQPARGLPDRQDQLHDETCMQSTSQ